MFYVLKGFIYSREGQRGRCERESESQADPVLRAEPDTGVDPMTPRLQPDYLIIIRMLRPFKNKYSTCRKDLHWLHSSDCCRIEINTVIPCKHSALN